MRYKEIKKMIDRLKPFNVNSPHIGPLKTEISENPSLEQFFDIFIELNIPYQCLTISEMQEVTLIMRESYILQNDKLLILDSVKKHLLELKLWLSE
jgi:hypothetical protein